MIFVGYGRRRQSLANYIGKSYFLAEEIVILSVGGAGFEPATPGL
jgi:hypothetical protein